ncbi:O51I1 protein, partial [Crocuta crocuta]
VFCILYLISIIGNLSILTLVVREPTLHQPMYYFLSMLSLNDLGVSFSTLPTVLATFCFNHRYVGFSACLVQMFFIHTFSFMESGILLAMSFDRFVAICDPLHYATVLTNGRILAMGLGILTKRAHPPSVFSHLPAMLGLNGTPFQPATLQLIGIPGMQIGHAWAALVFCILYLISIIGNLSILTLVVREPTLHQPMYYFLSMLSLNDLGVSFSTLPTVLATFCFNHRYVGFNACLVQMFFIHTFSFMESGILLAMSFDRFVAICDPLHYATVLTNGRILAMGLGILTKSFVTLFPFPFLVKRLPFCKGSILHHSYCLHPDLMKVACGDTHVNNIYGLFVVIFTYGVDSAFILLSYAQILRAVLAIASQEQRLKALNTCMSHI